MGILLTWTVRSPDGVGSVSSAMSTRRPVSRACRSAASRASAVSGGRKSWAVFPITSLRERPENSSPALLNLTSRKSAASLAKRMSGMFSTIACRNSSLSLSAFSAALRSVMSQERSPSWLTVSMSRPV
jgi:hypothetical protein